MTSGSNNLMIFLRINWPNWVWWTAKAETYIITRNLGYVKFIMRTDRTMRLSCLPE